MASEAQELLKALRDRGVSQAALADALGRSRSMISKVAVGKSSGALYVPAMRALLDGRPASPPDKRGGGVVPDRIALVGQGRILTRQSAGRDVRGPIAAAARRTTDTGHRDGRGRVAIRIEGSDANGRPISGTLFGKGGIPGEDLQRMIREALDANGVNPDRADPTDVVDALVDVIADLGSDAFDGGAGYFEGLGGGGAISSVSVEVR